MHELSFFELLLSDLDTSNIGLVWLISGMQF